MIEFFVLLFSLNSLLFIVTVQFFVYAIRGICEYLFPKLTVDKRAKKYWPKFALKILPGIVAIFLYLVSIADFVTGVNPVLYCMTIGALSGIIYDGIKMIIKSKLKKETDGGI